MTYSEDEEKLRDEMMNEGARLVREQEQAKNEAERARDQMMSEGATAMPPKHPTIRERIEKVIYSPAAKKIKSVAIKSGGYIRQGGKKVIKQINKNMQYDERIRQSQPKVIYRERAAPRQRQRVVYVEEKPRQQPRGSAYDSGIYTSGSGSQNIYTGGSPYDSGIYSQPSRTTRRKTQTQPGYRGGSVVGYLFGGGANMGAISAGYPVRRTAKRTITKPKCKPCAPCRCKTPKRKTKYRRRPKSRRSKR
jgi:hypothetical protein